MHRRVLRIGLTVLTVCSLTLSLASCGGDDDDDESASTTTEASGGETNGSDELSPDELEGYCRVARRTQGAPRSDFGDVVNQQIEVAPESLQEDLQILQDNIDILEQESLSREDTQLIGPPLIRLIIVQIEECDIPINFFGVGG